MGLDVKYIMSFKIRINYTDKSAIYETVEKKVKY